jgi:hypothetical protein
LTAAPVFRAETTIEICSHQLHTAPTPMSVRAQRAVPQPLEELVLLCLAKKPEERPTAEALMATLRGFAAEPWGRWDEADALAWWQAHGAAVADHRAQTVEAVDRTVVARAVAPATPSQTPSELGLDATELGHKPVPARTAAGG